MGIGYACLTVGVPATVLKTCMLKSVSIERLTDLIHINLKSLDKILDYNLNNDIKLFRICSDIIPFGSSPHNQLRWWDTFSEQLNSIGNKIKSNKIRVSMHPGQYTILNSLTEEVVHNAIEDIVYHNRFLDCLNLNESHKIVLHIGGVYGNKAQSMQRFIARFTQLDESLRKRIVIENDDRHYNIADVLEIGKCCNIPVVYDNLHNSINPYEGNFDDKLWINECNKTWKENDGMQKIHYAEQDKNKRKGSHSLTINHRDFLEFYKNLNDKNIDIMLEVKDKNISANKCINVINEEKNIRQLEIEWRKYKYSVLERSQADYKNIRTLLKDKSKYPAIEFYDLIEKSLNREIDKGNAINAAMHVWGYFKDLTSESVKDLFLKTINNYNRGSISLKAVKNQLLRLANLYEQNYLIESYYFLL